MLAIIHVKASGSLPVLTGDVSLYHLFLAHRAHDYRLLSPASSVLSRSLLLRGSSSQGATLARAAHVQQEKTPEENIRIHLLPKEELDPWHSLRSVSSSPICTPPSSHRKTTPSRHRLGTAPLQDAGRSSCARSTGQGTKVTPTLNSALSPWWEVAEVSCPKGATADRTAGKHRPAPVPAVTPQRQRSTDVSSSRTRSWARTRVAEGPPDPGDGAQAAGSVSCRRKARPGRTPPRVPRHSPPPAHKVF